MTARRYFEEILVAMLIVHGASADTRTASHGETQRYFRLW